MTDTNSNQNWSISSEPPLQPKDWDVVAGIGVTLLDGAVLGGLPGLFKKWESRDLPVRLAALSEAPHYAIDGLRLLLDATWSSDSQIRDFAVGVIAHNCQSFLAAPVPVDALELFQEAGEILYYYELYEPAESFFAACLQAGSTSIWTQLYHYLSGLFVRPFQEPEHLISDPEAYRSMTYSKFEKNPERFLCKVLAQVDGFFIIEQL